MANPSVVVGSINDKEIKATIDSIVSHVDTATKKMAEGFNTALNSMSQSLKSFGDVAKGISSASKQRSTSGKQEVQANKEVADSYQTLVNAIRQAQERANKRFGVGDEILDLRAKVNMLKRELKELEDARPFKYFVGEGLSNKYGFGSGVFDLSSAKEYNHLIELIQAKITELQQRNFQLVRAGETEKAKEVSRELENWRTKLAQAEQEKINWAAYHSAAQRVTSELNATNAQIKQMGQAMIDADNAEKKLAEDAEKVATAYAKITSRNDTKKAFAQAAGMDDSTLEGAIAKAERYRAIMKEVYNTPFVSAKQYKDLQMALSGVEQKIRELRSGKTGDVVVDESTRVRKEAEAIKRSMDEAIAKEKERRDALVQTANVAQENARKIIEAMHWQLGKEGDTPIMGLRQLNDEIVKMHRAYFEMSDVEKESPIGRALKRDIDAANTALEAVQRYNRNLMGQQTGGASLEQLRNQVQGLKNEYAALSQEETKSARGTDLINKIHKTEAAIRELQQRLSRPTSLKNALDLPVETLDQIAHKIQQLNLYKNGLNITDPKQLAEMKQVDQELSVLKKKQDDLMGANSRLIQSNNALARSWNYMKNRLAFYFTIGASTQFVKNLIEVRAQYEMTERALGILVDSAEKGSQIFNQLSDMALVSPYTLIELSNAAKQLTAYDVAAKDVVDTTRRLADMAAAVGIPIDRLTYALGQIKAYGYLNARDARMFANAGIPLVKQLSDYYTELEGRMVSVGDIYDRIKKKSIGYSEVMSVINKMTDEGGKFFDFQAKMAGTLKVQLANLTLAWNNMLNDIGKSEQGILAGAIKALKEFFLQWKNANRLLTSFAVGFGLWKLLQVTSLAVGRNIRIIRTNLQAANVDLSYTGVLGQKVTGIIKGLGAAFKTLFSAQTGIMLAIFALVDMYNKASQAEEAIHELNKSVREGAVENSKQLSKMLDSYKDLYELTTKQGKVVSAQYVGSMSNDEMVKTWQSVREELETSTSSSKVFMGRLLRITDISKRLGEAFKIAAQIRDAQGALSDLDENAIKVGQDMSAWYNLWLGDRGLVEGIKYYKEFFDAAANKDLTIIDFKSIFESAQETYNRWNEKLWTEFQNNARETAESLSKIFSDLKFNPEQMREGFEQAANKIFEGKGLDPTAELQARIELEKQFIARRKAIYDAAINEQLEKNNQAEAAQLAQSYSIWLQRFGQNQALVNGFYDWLKAHHASELQSMFGNMTQEEINHIDWSKKEWQDWAIKNAKEFSEQYHVSFNDLWKWVQQASTWQVHIGVVLDTTVIQKSEYEILKNWDTQANNSYEAIGRLNQRIDELNKKTKRTKEEEDELAKARNERQAEQQKYDEARLHGGKSSREETANRKAEAAANKRARVGAKVQKQAEDEVAKALKDELSLIKEMQSNYDKLRKAGVSNTDAINLATKGYEGTIERVNNVLSKYGINKFNATDFAGKNVKDLLDRLEKQRNALIASGKVKRSSLKDLEVEIQKLTIDAKEYDLKKITDGLNNELSKIKDEYEIAMELDANPELGQILADAFGFDVSGFPKTVEDAIKKIQEKTDRAVADYMFLNNENISTDELAKNLFDVMDGDIEEWAERIGAKVGSDLYNSVKDAQTKARDLFKKDASDMISDWEKLLQKYAEYEYRRSEIIKQAEKERATARKHGASKEILDAIDEKERRNLAKLDFEQFQKSPQWLVATGDLASLTNNALRTLIKSLEEYRRKAKNLDPKEIKQINNALKNLRKQLRSGNPFHFIADAMEEARDRASLYDAELDRIQDEIQKITTAAFENGEITEEQSEKIKTLAELWEKVREEQIEAGKVSATTLVDGITQSVNAVKGAITMFGELAQAIGGKNMTEAAETITKVVDVVEKAAMGASVGAQAGGGWGALIGGVVGALAGVIINWADTWSGNKAITEQVQDINNSVRELEISYKKLKNAVDDAYGDAEIGAKQAAIANKQLQLTNLEAQLELELSRKQKNRDEDAILDYKGKIEDLKREIVEDTREITTSLLGISSVGDAAESLVSSMIDAFKEGGDWMKFFDETFEEMIDNMIMKAIVGKVIGERIQAIFDYVDKIKNKDNLDLANTIAEEENKRNAMLRDNEKIKAEWETWRQLTGNDIEDFEGWKQRMAMLEEQEKKIQALKNEYANQATGITPEDVDYLREMINGEREATKQDFEFYAELFGLRYGQNKGKASLSALQQGIQGITEDTAGALEAYMNSVSQQVYLHSDLLMQIRDAVVEIDGSVQVSIQAQMLLQLQQSYQIQTAIQAILLGWSNASGMAVKVQMV